MNLFEKFELTVDLVSMWRNPYDYDEIDLQCVFLSPLGNNDTVDAFYMQPFVVDKSTNQSRRSGQSFYKVRFSPRSTGTWKYFLIYKNNKTYIQSAISQFSCTNNNSANHGFIQKGSSNYLQFHDGKQFIPIGENANCPAENVFTDYTSWTEKLSANGANLMNVWMIYAGFGIEWSSINNSKFDGLKRYNQQNAFHLDWLLDRCNDKGMYLLLGLNTCGGQGSVVNPPWSENPYNKKNGGPCVNQGDYFKNADAKALQKNRLRYIVARYGYSSNIMAWNLFIEADGIYDYKKYKSDIVTWNEDMGLFLKKVDNNNHLVTTSYSSKLENENTWKLPVIDFTQTHSYIRTAFPEKRIVQANRSYLNSFKKPTLTGEFGIDPENIDLEKFDPLGIYFHNTIWSSALGGAMGPALTYWWTNYIDALNLYYHFKPLSAFLGSLDLVSKNYQPAKTSVQSAATEVTLQPNAGWGAKTDSSFTIDHLGNTSPAEDKLGVYLYGRLLNTEQRMPASFRVNFLNKGQLTIDVGEATIYPKLSVSTDAGEPVETEVQPNRQYTFTIPAGNHVITIKNSGKDWLWVKAYKFSDAGSTINAYVLQNKTKTSAAGYVLNQQYNWKARYARERLAAQRGTITIYNMQQGNYRITFYDPLTLKKLQVISLSSQKSELIIELPVITWDAAFTAEKI